MSLKCRLLSADAQVPRQASAAAAGYDLHADRRVRIYKSQRVVVTTGVCVELPSGHYGQIAERSSLALQGLSVHAGVIDSDYRGELGIVMSYHGPDEFYEITVGQRIAQLLILPLLNSTGQFQQVDALEETERGSGGFGSTGK